MTPMKKRMIERSPAGLGKFTLLDGASVGAQYGQYGEPAFPAYRHGVEPYTRAPTVAASDRTREVNTGVGNHLWSVPQCTISLTPVARRSTPMVSGQRCGHLRQRKVRLSFAE